MKSQQQLKRLLNGEPVVMNSSWKSLLVFATHRLYEQSPRIKWEQPLWFLFLVLANNYYSKWENCIFSSRVLLSYYKIYWWRKDFTSLLIYYIVLLQHRHTTYYYCLELTIHFKVWTVNFIISVHFIIQLLIKIKSK